MKIRVGIIGTGFGGKVHAPLMNAHPGFEVVAISSVHKGNIADIRNATGVQNVYTNWREMLHNEELDLVSIASAPDLHAEMVVEAYKLNKHVLCEKPMAFDTGQTTKMIEARDRTGKFGFINFEWRFMPARLKVKELLDKKVLGDILHISYTVTFPSYERLTTSERGWLGKKEHAGGMLGAIGSHMFDSLMWWTGDKVASVYGQLTTHVPEFNNEHRTADDAFHVIGKFEKIPSFTVGLVSASRHGIGWRLEIMGTEGTLIMTDDKKVEVGLGNGPLEEVDVPPAKIPPEGVTQPALSYFTAFGPMLDLVHNSFVKNTYVENVPTFEDGHEVQRILDAVRKSSEEGRVVDLKKGDN